MDNRRINQETVRSRAEHLLSSLLILFHSECKQMAVESFKKSVSHIPLSRHIYKALQDKKIVGVSGSPKHGYKVQYSTSVHPNIEMCIHLIYEGLKTNSARNKDRKIVKHLPETMTTTRMTPQEKLLHDIAVMKTAFEKKYDAKVEILVEVTMVTTIQL